MPDAHKQGVSPIFDGSRWFHGITAGSFVLFFLALTWPISIQAQSKDEAGLSAPVVPSGTTAPITDSKYAPSDSQSGSRMLLSNGSGDIMLRTVDGASLRAQPDEASPRAGIVGMGQPVAQVRQEGNWHQVRVDGRTAWIHAELVEPLIVARGAQETPQWLQVSQRTNLRSAPGIQSRRIASVTPTSRLQAISDQADWTRVSFKQSGWLHRDYLVVPSGFEQPDFARYLRTTAGVNLRDGPGIETGIIDVIGPHWWVEERQRAGEWVQVTLELRGWIYDPLLQPSGLQHAPVMDAVAVAVGKSAQAAASQSSSQPGAQMGPNEMAPANPLPQVALLEATEERSAAATDNANSAAEIDVDNRPGRDMALPTGAPSPSQIAQDASKLILAGRYDEAYLMLATYETKYSGAVAYDYLLGLAALDSGRYSEAIFALERATVVRPDFSGARMELARAHFESQDNERARVHFLRLKEESPPPDVNEVIDAYIAAIDERARRYQIRKQGWINIRSGYDSNANGAVDQKSFLNFFLSDTNTETGSAFTALNLGGAYSRPLGGEYMTGFNASLAHRLNPSASFVDSTSATGSWILVRPEGDWQWTASVGGYWNALDKSFNEKGTNFDVSLGRDLDDNWRLDSMMRITAARFKDILAATDVNRLLYGVTFGRSYEGDLPWRIKLSALGGRDLATDRNTAHSNVKVGGRVAFAWPARDSREYGIDFGVLKTKYNGRKDFFGFSRDDTQLSASFYHRWAQFRGGPWNLTANLRWIDGKSTVGLFEYNRVEISLAARRDLK